jgi:uncharacterized 2Fe-2S/4Fe-4S cluster protein (DUF4445 family)
MAKVTFQNESTGVIAESGMSLLQALRKNGIYFEAPCNGNGLCGKCRVQVIRGNGEKTNELACQFVVGEEDITIITMPAGETPMFSNGEIGEGPQDMGILMNINDCGGAEPLGLAIDLGTTGVSVELLSLSTGEVLENASFLNPQCEYGGDVLTRIGFCMENPQNTFLLQKIVLGKLNDAIRIFAQKGHNPNMICKVAVAGNAAMQHIFAGVDPSLLAKSPYTPVFNHSLVLKSGFSPVRLLANKNAAITLLPSISGYVGGDVVAGMVSAGFLKKKRALFIDIGTNGEIALINGGKLLCASTAAGPAFEGMNIACGQRAERGAIDRFFEETNGETGCSVIGGSKPTGICGSGLIDIVAVLLRKGIIDASGKLAGKRYSIADGVYITQKDVRQVQLAKAAIAAGIKILLNEARCPYGDVGVIYIAGSFGYHLNEASIKTVGLIDPAYGGEIVFIGNSSLEGAKMALMDNKALEIMEELRSVARNIELSENPRFQDAFMKELGF